MDPESFRGRSAYRVLVDVEAEIGIEPDYDKVGRRSWSNDRGSMFDAADRAFLYP